MAFSKDNERKSETGFWKSAVNKKAIHENIGTNVFVVHILGIKYSVA